MIPDVGFNLAAVCLAFITALGLVVSVCAAGIVAFYLVRRGYYWIYNAIELYRYNRGDYDEEDDLEKYL